MRINDNEMSMQMKQQSLVNTEDLCEKSDHFTLCVKNNVASNTANIKIIVLHAWKILD